MSARDEQGIAEVLEALALALRRAARAHLRLEDGDYWPSDVADAQARALVASPEFARCVHASPPSDPELNVVRRIVNAWDCCGTCAGGVLARCIADAKAESDLHAIECERIGLEALERAILAERKLADAKAEGWDEAVRAVAGVDPQAIHNPYQDHEGSEVDAARVVVRAWDEGYAAGHRQACPGECVHGVTRNPYNESRRCEAHGLLPEHHARAAALGGE